MHTTKHFRVRFGCPECDPVKHEKSYLEKKAREMGQRVRRINETCRKGVQQMSITVPPFVWIFQSELVRHQIHLVWSPPLLPHGHHGIQTLLSHRRTAQFGFHRVRILYIALCRRQC